MIAFLIGGPTRPYVYDETVTRRLLALARQVLDQGGTPYLTTSRRTPEALAEALERDLPEGAILHRWRAEAPPEENPFLALLGLSDGCIVTADSASMIVEVASLGRRLAILDLPVGGGWGRLELARRRLLRALFEPPRGGLLDGLRCGLARTAFRSRLVWASRDFRVLHEWLVDEGFAVWAGEELVTPPGPLPDDRERVARRVGALLPDDRRAVAKPEAAASE
jgi:hypothetical protein